MVEDACDPLRRGSAKQVIRGCLLTITCPNDENDETVAASRPHIYPVILCVAAQNCAHGIDGEYGARAPFPGLEDTARWAHRSLGLRPPIVFCAATQRGLVAHRLASAEIPSDVLLCEPVARGSVSALAAAALYVSERNSNGLILVLPAGRRAPDDVDFCSSLSRATEIAAEGHIVTFGCKCDRDRQAKDGWFASRACTGTSGIFLASARAAIEELEQHGSAAPAACAAALAHRVAADGWIELGAEAYSAAPDESLDAMLRNGSHRTVAMQTDIDWCALALSGASLNQSNPAVDETREDRSHRPWGHYVSIDRGERFQVKHITVNPGARLSLQMHHHRAEHWIVVGGTCRVTCGNEVRLLHENQSAYIPLGTTHRIENPGKLPLHLIEVQVGAYLDEDDIVRFEDSYGRA
jgi:mannose-6-phosphate isomerase-like protein (cupin superfamily)